MADLRRDSSDKTKITAKTKSPSLSKMKSENSGSRPHINEADHIYEILRYYDEENDIDKELRLKQLKERQNEDRQRKLEELKAQEIASQKLKEEIEHGRRKRLEELRVREDIRRQQVEERKRAINEAERDRLEFILKRNQEREARIDAKKRNERSNIVFAFGSSTPRLLGPSDHQSSFWGHRRATSTQNITSMSTSLTRRQSERDLDGGSKKRATSASGLERSAECTTPVTPAGCASGYMGRRRTDLMPTIPARDSPFSTSRKSLSQSPGRAYSMTRLDQLAKPRKRPDLPAVAESSYPYHSGSLSSPHRSSVTRSMSHLAVGKTAPSPTRSRPPLNKADSRSMHHLSSDGGGAPPLLLLPRTTRATQLRQQKLLASSNSSDASSRPSSALSQQSTTSVSSSVSVRHRPASARKPRPASIAITGITHDLKTSLSLDGKKGSDTRPPPIPKARKSISKPPSEKMSASHSGDVTPKAASTAATTAATSPVSPDASAKPVVDSEAKQHRKPPDEPKGIDKKPLPVENDKPSNVDRVVGQEQTNLAGPTPVPKDTTPSTKEVDTVVTEVKKDEPNNEKIIQETAIAKTTEIKNTDNAVPQVVAETAGGAVKSQPPDPPKVIEVISNTLENKVAIEEINNEMSTSYNESLSSTSKPRITTEEEAKAALAERRRLAREEAERLAEQEKQRIELEARLEMERQQREEEAQRLLIEQQRAAEQERLQEAIREVQKREEEERLKREEEQRLKQMKEEAERKAREESERQKAELQEKHKNEEKEREARRKRVEAIMLRTRGKNANMTSQNSEDKNEKNSEDNNENKSENHINGTKSAEQENHTKNGKNIIVDNIIPNETVKNANNITVDSINSTDSINSNSNNSWQTTQQYDS